MSSITAALSGVFQHRSRAVLTMLGIIIGISSVILIDALGSGVKNQVLADMNRYNMSVIEVYTMVATKDEHFLRLSDVEALYKIDNIQYIAAENSFWGANLHLRNPGDTKEGYLAGVDPNYRYIEEMPIAYGRFISDADMANSLNVCVIQETTANEVFGKSDAVGQKITVETWVGNAEFTVIGVIRRDPGLGVVNGTSTNSLAMVPITALNSLFGQGDIINMMSIITKTPSMDTAAAITRFLSVRHNNPDGYYVQSLTDMASEVDMMVTMVAGFVTLVAAISLFVGGVGVMNIMLVSVKERTREIGIRKALGATNANIRMQFLMEAMILTGTGGLIGIALGLGLAKLTGYVIVNMVNVPINPVASPVSVIIAFGVAAAVGLFFGVYPAGKAAKLDPIEALRYE